MIEQYLVSELGTIAALAGKCYPVAAPLGDDELPICLYRRVSGEVRRDLSGAAAFYVEVFRLDLLDEDMDRLCALEQEVARALEKENQDAGDFYLYSAEVAPALEDDYDLRTDTLLRSVNYTVIYGR